LQLSIETIVQSGIDNSKFQICHFKGTRHPPEIGAHLYVIVPIKKDNQHLVCMITSKVDKRINYYRRVNPNALQGLVRINKSELNFLKKDSLIDCNQAELLTKEELIIRIKHDKNFKLHNHAIPMNIKEKLIKAIKNSPLINVSNKRLLKPI